jgi:hypoxanthine phosphoribosyltransferase
MSTDISPFLSETQIESLNAELAVRIAEDYKPLLLPGDTLTVIVTLKGAMLFASDLIRMLKIPILIDFVRVASYGGGTKSSGSVKLIKDIESPIQNKHVLILDEIVDSGRTLAFLLEKFKEQNPKSLKICALLNKPSRREVPVEVDYIGQDVEDKFLVGYGLDFNEKYRNLPYIGCLS